MNTMNLEFKNFNLEIRIRSSDIVLKKYILDNFNKQEWDKDCDSIFNNYYIKLNKTQKDYLLYFYNIINEKNTTISHGEFAVFLKEHNNLDNYIYATSKKNKGTWYYKDNGIYNQLDDDNTNLKLFLSTNIYDRLNDNLKKIIYNAYGLSHLYEKYKNLEFLIKSIYDISKKLRTNKYIKETITFSSKFLVYDKFIEKCDSNPNLLGFTDGVYDLQKNIFITNFEDIEQLTPVSKTTGYSYYDMIEHVSETSEDNKQKLENFLNDLHLDKDINEYFYNMLARNMGDEKPEEFYIWSGNGSNGKSCFTNLLYKSFGDDYVASIPSSIFTEKKPNTTSANPILASLKGAKSAILQETEDNEKLNVSLIKEYTGGDPISARGLYQDPITFKPYASFYTCCNDIPKLNNIDGGIIRRLRIINWNTKFVENPIKNTNQRQIDLTIKNNFDNNWDMLFMNKLLQLRKNMILPLKIPNAVMSSTNKYIGEQEVIKGFIDNHIEYTGDKNDFIITNNLLGDFNNFQSSQYETNKPITKQLFNKQIKKYLMMDKYYDKKTINGKSYRNVFIEYKYKKYEEEEEDEDEEDESGA
jgi:P4 family phage/plasmid primase-like protien